jgi:S-adenosylmethionine decarboxylase
VHFGEHVTIDGYDGSPHRLDDQALVRSCIAELCKCLEMHQLSETVVVHAPDGGGKDSGGWSGFVIIAESHIGIHTFPKRRFLSADVYSCKTGIDADRIAQFFKSTFLLNEIEVQLIKRGLRYPARDCAQ